MLKLIDNINVDFLTEIHDIIQDAEYMSSVINAPCRVSFYITEHRSWDQMKLPVLVENNRFKCIGPKPNAHIYHCKYKVSKERPLISSLIKKYNLERFVIALATPGFQMPWHTDYFGGQRIHIPIITNEQCFIETKDNKEHCKVGSVYVLDTNVLHTACNLGNTNRLHLIGDIDAVC